MRELRGRASSVTDLGDGTVLRTGGFPEREARIMEHVRMHGFPVPHVHEVRQDALVLERIAGPTMGQALTRRPWLMNRYMSALARLHVSLHAIRFEDSTVIHFDMHPDNVLMGTDGPMVIDWTNAHAGDPDADVAMTWLILETSAGLGGRLLARLFAARTGREPVRRGLAAARDFRVADPNVTDAERGRALRARP